MRVQLMTYRKTLTAMIAASLVFGGAASAAVTPLRQAAPVGENEQLGGAGVIGWVIALAVAAGVALVIIDDDEEDPVSP